MNMSEWAQNELKYAQKRLKSGSLSDGSDIYKNVMKGP